MVICKVVAYGRWSLTRSGRVERVDCMSLQAFLNKRAPMKLKQRMGRELVNNLCAELHSLIMHISIPAKRPDLRTFALIVYAHPYCACNSCLSSD